MQNNKPLIGFTCAYTPLPLIHAAGFTPYRILPMGDAPDQAGQLLHDNLCPHVKRILDRALHNDIPKLSGIVLMNSCDAMRRLYDALKQARPTDRIVLVDFPVTQNSTSSTFFGQQISLLANTLSEWSGKSLSQDAVQKSINTYNELANLLAGIKGSRVARQQIYNQAVTEPVEQTLENLKTAQNHPEHAHHNIPVYLFGNVLPDPQAFALFESCGLEIVADNLCTGSRSICAMDSNATENIYLQIAQGLLSRPLCARTFNPDHPGKLVEEIIADAKTCKARGVIGHTVKFCDPYLSRMPWIRSALKNEGIPLLLLEGDCTLRSIGQQRTRIEAFAEMLKS